MTKTALLEIRHAIRELVRAEIASSERGMRLPEEHPLITERVNYARLKVNTLLAMQLKAQEKISA